jgi:hypothetical protein
LEIGVIGFEPISQNSQSIDNNELTESINACLCVSLCKPLQKDPENIACNSADNQTDPELEKVITAWPKLPEHTKAAVLSLVDTAKKQ